MERFTEGDHLTDLARDADAPAYVRDAPPDPAFQGVALRFLAELSTVTGDPRWRGIARDVLRGWAGSIPADGRGAGELGAPRSAPSRPARSSSCGPIRSPRKGSGCATSSTASRTRAFSCDGSSRETPAPRSASACRKRGSRRSGSSGERRAPRLREAITLRRAWQRARERIGPGPQGPLNRAACGRRGPAASSPDDEPSPDPRPHRPGARARTPAPRDRGGGAGRRSRRHPAP